MAETNNIGEIAPKLSQEECTTSQTQFMRTQ